MHIELSLMKVFVKLMDKESEGFAYWRQKFPKISEAKIKEGISIGPQTAQPVKDDQECTVKLNSTETEPREELENVCRNLLGNEKAENNSEIMQ